MKFPTLNEQMDIICSGAVDIIHKDELCKKIEYSILNNKSLVVKFGVDPSTPDLHLGHSVVLQKLSEIQNIGHEATLIIGDYTAIIGDPSGRNKTRPMISKEKISKNIQSYIEQISKIINVDTLKILFNSKWLRANDIE